MGNYYETDVTSSLSTWVPHLDHVLFYKPDNFIRIFISQTYNRLLQFSMISANDFPFTK